MAGRSFLPEWLLAELEPVLRLAATLTGSRPGAIDLVTSSLATDTSWRDVPERLATDGYDLTPRLRTAVVRTFLTSPLGRSRPLEAARGLDALSGPARAAVVLRDGERLTTGEVVSIMDRPGRRIADELGRVPAGEHDAEIALLRASAPGANEVATRYRTTSGRIRRRRRTRAALLAAAAVSVVAAVVVPTMILPRLPHEARPPGQWRYSHEVRPADGWQIRYRYITEDTEQTAIAIPWPVDEPLHCLVTVTVVGVEPDRNGLLRPTTVGGRPGFLVDQPGNNLALKWQYADAAWADLECPAGTATESVLRDIADRVRFTDNRQQLPFTLAALPDQYRIRMVAASIEDPELGLFVVLDPPDNTAWPVLVIGPASPSGDPTTALEQCLDATKMVCVSAAQSDDRIPVDLNIQRQVVAETVGLVRPAADPADQSTWIDAITLPNP